MRKSAELLWKDPSLKPSQAMKQLPKEYRSLAPSILLSASKVKERFGVAGSIDEDAIIAIVINCDDPNIHHQTGSFNFIILF